VQALIKQFQEDANIITNLFRFMFFTVFNHDPSSATYIVKYQNLQNFLRKSTVITENWVIRNEVLKKLKEILSMKTANQQDMRQLNELVSLMLFKVQEVTE
jgi:hypothetical protein